MREGICQITEELRYYIHEKDAKSWNARLAVLKQAKQTPGFRFVIEEDATAASSGERRHR